MGIGTVSGPLFGGVIADTIGWRWAFWINTPIALCSLAMLVVAYPSETAQSKLLISMPFWDKLLYLDPIGATSLITGLSFLTAFLESYSTSIEFSGSDIGLLVAAILFLLIFALHLAFVRLGLAIIPRHMIAERMLWSCCCASFFLFAGFINFVFFLSMFFQSALLQSPEESAISLLPYIVGVSVATALTDALVGWARGRTVPHALERARSSGCKRIDILLFPAWGDTIGANIYYDIQQAVTQRA
ncbi:Aspyridones efflux protein [Fusarium oxysporum f. sp. raphani]|uniref:Aspyridones efflux protein n=1 Tax=Fusarium oxysporum f. sp. raphani TaxID=96318 RepID=A0A8J5PTL6_FUSOX|nr:Aspyridones efflux protein [Fusarium oxysporum f. sp. raphani]